MLPMDMSYEASDTDKGKTKERTCCEEVSSRLLDRLAPILEKVQAATARARHNDVGLENAVSAFEDILAGLKSDRSS
jgi:hypothetical protein